MLPLGRAENLVENIPLRCTEARDFCKRHERDRSAKDAAPLLELVKKAASKSYCGGAVFRYWEI